jgi:hypothetical protein
MEKLGKCIFIGMIFLLFFSVGAVTYLTFMQKQSQPQTPINNSSPPNIATNPDNTTIPNITTQPNPPKIDNSNNQPTIQYSNPQSNNVIEKPKINETQAIEFLKENKTYSPDCGFSVSFTNASSLPLWKIQVYNIEGILIDDEYVNGLNGTVCDKNGIQINI